MTLRPARHGGRDRALRPTSVPRAPAWLRLVWAGVIMLLIVRPRRSSFTPPRPAGCVGARRRHRRRDVALHGRRRSGFRWAPRARWSSSARSVSPPLAASARRAADLAGLAAVGVVLLTEPWHGPVELVGVLCALGAACCWAAYILLTQRVGDEVTGLNGLAVSLPVAGPGRDGLHRSEHDRRDDLAAVDRGDRARDPAAVGAVLARAAGAAAADDGGVRHADVPGAGDRAGRGLHAAATRRRGCSRSSGWPSWSRPGSERSAAALGCTATTTRTPPSSPSAPPPNRRLARFAPSGG